MPLRTAILLALLSAPLAVAQQTPTTNPETLRKLRIQELETEVESLPKIPATMPSDIVSFGLEDSHLVVTTPLAGRFSEARIISDHLPGVVRLTTFPINDSRRRADQNFILVREDLTNSAVGDISVIISNAAGRVMISRDTESDSFLSSVELIQDPPGMAPSIPPQEPVRLYVNVEDLTQHQILLKTNVSGKDFVDLRKRRAPLVDRYVRPIFRELQQESTVFAIPPEVAWQVLGFSNDQPDPQFEAKIKSIVANLGADDFHQRQAAAAELKSIGKPATAELAKIDRGKLSPEQNAAIESFMADALPLNADDIKHWANDKNFLIDILFSDDRALRRKALDRLSEIEGRKVELEFEFDPAGRIEAVNKLRDQLITSSLPSLNANTDDPAAK